MCQKCKALQADIIHVRGFLGYGVDNLTSERLTQLITDKETQLAAMHCLLKPV